MTFVKGIKKIVNALVQAWLSEVHTHIPAVVVSYDEETNLCSIQPCISQIRVDNIETGSQALPPIDDIPVKMFGAGNVQFTVPVKEGTYGVYHVAEDDISQWLSEGGTVSPSSAERFNLSDGFFEPGIYPLGDSDFEPVPTDRISMRTNDGIVEISVLEDKTVLIKTGNGDKIKIEGGNLVVHGVSDAAALATKIDSYFLTLDTVLRTWPVGTSDGGAALKSTYIAAQPAPPTTTASQKIKVDG